MSDITARHASLAYRNRIRVANIITGLQTGGAQMMLYKLLTQLDPAIFDLEVISLTDKGPVGSAVAATGTPVRALGMPRGIPDPVGIFRLSTWLRRAAPDVVHTWLYHADLLGGLATKLAGTASLVWGIRQSNLGPCGNKRATLWTAAACARLSRLLPDRIVCCSKVALQAHVAFGYTNQKMIVIPNGFDLDLFVPDGDARSSVRQELGIQPEAVLIGLVARFDPQKDHQNFIAAASRLGHTHGDVSFVLIGEGVTWTNSWLASWIRESGIAERFFLLGLRTDIPRITAALDIATLASFGEGFPNVVGEAMACGVPCVVTDVGDASEIVGATGFIVPPRDPDALANAWQALLRLGVEGRSRLGGTARRRMCDRYDLRSVAARYAELYLALAEEHVRHRRST